jgi:hypothetical protein
MRGRLALFVLALAVAACGGSRPASDPSNVVVAPARPAPPPPPKVPSAERSFRDNLRRATADATADGWIVKETRELPGHNAAILLLEPTAEKAPAYKLERFVAVGTGPFVVHTGESGMIDVMKTKKDQLTWDLRGDGSTYVVLHLTPCGASCGIAAPKVLELVNDRFVEPSSVPSCPTCIQDGDRDGIPEFAYRIFALSIAPCARVSCGPSLALELEVRGLESWEGGRFVRNLRDFTPLYFERLKRVQRAARRARKVGDKAKRCPLGALQVAAELYVYGQLIGEKPDRAMKNADDVMRGYDTAPCSGEYDLLEAPRPWSELRAELLKQKLPVLDLRRVKRR